MFIKDFEPMRADWDICLKLMYTIRFFILTLYFMKNHYEENSPYQRCCWTLLSWLLSEKGILFSYIYYLYLILFIGSFNGLHPFEEQSKWNFLYFSILIKKLDFIEKSRMFAFETLINIKPVEVQPKVRFLFSSFHNVTESYIYIYYMYIE